MDIVFYLWAAAIVFAAGVFLYTMLWKPKPRYATSADQWYCLNLGGDGKPIKCYIGQYADYLDTGVWEIKNGTLVPPADLTDRQLRDFSMVFGELFRGDSK